MTSLIAAGIKPRKTSLVRAVANSGELRRILAMKRRPADWKSARDDIETARRELKRIYGNPDSPEQLRDVQVVSLLEIMENARGFLPVAAGAGKTYIFHLAPLVMQAARPVMLVTPDLKKKTFGKDIPRLREHWQVHPNLTVISYYDLQIAANRWILYKLMPDMLLLDEVQNLARRESARTKRMIEYMDEHPDTIVVAGSGTITDKSIKDYHHIARWTHGAHDMWLPSTYAEGEEWANALDEEVDPLARIAPGALRHFCADNESPREGYRRRMLETPGVITSLDERVPNALLLREIVIPVPDAVQTLLERVRNDWEDPNGDPIMEAPKKAALARQIALGFWLRWDPPAPRDWLEARKYWAAYVRHVLAHNRRGLDSELQVLNELHRKKERGETTHPAYDDWIAVRDTFKPRSVPQWVDPFAADAAAAWLRDHPRGICWVQNPAFGERVAAIAGCPYLGAGPDAAQIILDITGPIVASYTHAKGKDMQDRYDANLITSPRPSGRLLEQLLARTHRTGQRTDTVTADFFRFTPEQKDAIRRAKNRARYIEDTGGGIQRANFCDWAFDP